MTKSRLPEITLTCRNGHPFTTKAAGGITVRCKTCGVGRGVPAGRPKTIKEAADWSDPNGPLVLDQPHPQDQDHGETSELVTAWADEAPAATNWREMPMQAAGIDCPDCKAPAWWHSTRAALVCLECSSIIESPGLEERAAAHADGLARKRAGTSREVAVIDPAAEATARAARIELHRQREVMQQSARKALTWCDPDDYESPQGQRLAANLGGLIRGYLKEIDRAGDMATLEEIDGELETIWNSNELAALKTEDARQEARQAAIAEAERQEAEMRAVRAAEERRQLEAQRQRPALPPAPPKVSPAPTPAFNPNTYAIAQVAKFAMDVQKKNQEKADAIAQNGACKFCRKPTPATRVYGIAAPAEAWALWGSGGYMNTGGSQVDTSAAHIDACAKHYADAQQWIEQQHPRTATYYWEK